MDVLIIIGSALLVPVIIMIAGGVMKSNAVGEINYLLGYRTKRSMSSSEAWHFANELCGKIWLIGGLVMIPLTIIGMFISIRLAGLEAGVGIICMLQIAAMLLSLIPVESILKKNFDEDGNRIQ